MGRDGSDPIAVHSSIALLQERFRQLQRVKEMREEKELQRMLTEPPPNKLFNPASSPNYEPFKFFFQPDFGLPLSTTSPPPQLSLSLWPCPQSNISPSCFSSMDNPMFVSSQFSQTRSLRANLSDKSEDFDDDVDTSLHL
ncbi:uncharacterized protein LOC116209155 [Punica granatum]|uniref:Uncharacterized protein n=2 Tax=Punica granatum TaxID=22663 RepID=A0A218XL77_PUNGR|nr:uncharacterized protein LOC116209155 [Punica granatum]OWM85634.1 hypothetical protein CDL15_Pgr029057 [Punica granatum]PKI33174.1 hypothetical protein CRG98_046436 [Punica granatum]